MIYPYDKDYMIVAERMTNECGKQNKNGLSILVSPPIQEETLANIIASIYNESGYGVIVEKSDEGYNFNSYGDYMGQLKFGDEKVPQKLSFTSKPELIDIIFQRINR